MIRISPKLRTTEVVLVSAVLVSCNRDLETALAKWKR